MHSGPLLPSGGPVEDRRNVASLAGGSSLPVPSSQPSPLDARDPWTDPSNSTSTSPLDPSPSWIDPAIAASLAASLSASASISASASAAPLDRTSRPDTANAIVVHTGNMKKYLGTVPVAARPLGAAALASGGRRIVFAVEDVDRAPETGQESAATRTDASAVPHTDASAVPHTDATAVPRMDASANASAPADTAAGEAADRDASSAHPSAAPDSEKEQARNGIRKGKIEVWTCWGKQRAEPRRTMSMMLR